MTKQYPAFFLVSSILVIFLLGRRKDSLALALCLIPAVLLVFLLDFLTGGYIHQVILSHPETGSNYSINNIINVFYGTYYFFFPILFISLKENRKDKFIFYSIILSSIITFFFELRNTAGASPHYIFPIFLFSIISFNFKKNKILYLFFFLLLSTLIFKNLSVFSVSHLELSLQKTMNSFLVNHPELIIDNCEFKVNREITLDNFIPYYYFFNLNNRIYLEETKNYFSSLLNKETTSLVILNPINKVNLEKNFFEEMKNNFNHFVIIPRLNKEDVFCKTCVPAFYGKFKNESLGLEFKDMFYTLPENILEDYYKYFAKYGLSGKDEDYTQPEIVVFADKLSSSFLLIFYLVFMFLILKEFIQ